MDTGAWCDLVKRMGKFFKWAAGCAAHLATEAARREQSSLPATGAKFLTVTCD